MNVRAAAADPGIPEFRNSGDSARYSSTFRANASLKARGATIKCTVTVTPSPWLVFDAQQDPWRLDNKVDAPALLGKHLALDSYLVAHPYAWQIDRQK